MKKIFILFQLSLILASTPSLCKSSEYQEGNYYKLLPKQIEVNEAVMQVFSFACPACYNIEYQYKFSEEFRKKLPKGITFKQYHLAMGNATDRLTQAWSVALAFNCESKVLFPLFDLVRNSQKEASINEIKNIFIKNTKISEKEFEEAWHSLSVKMLINRQKELVHALNLKGVPAFFVKGKYEIDFIELIKNPELNHKKKNNFVHNLSSLIINLLNNKI